MKPFILSIVTIAALSLGVLSPAMANDLPPRLPDAGGCGPEGQNTCGQWGSTIEDYCYDPFHNIDDGRRPGDRPMEKGYCSYWDHCDSGYTCTDRNWWGSGTCVDTKRFYQEACSDMDQCQHGNVDMACFQVAGASEPQCVLDEEVTSFGQSCSCWFGSWWECQSSDCNGHFCAPNHNWESRCVYDKDESFFDSAWDYFVSDEEDQSDKDNCPF